MKDIKNKLQVLIGTLFVMASTNVFSAMPLNTELKCEIIEMSFFVNGQQTSKNSPTNQKPTYYRFDGKQLFAYYKGANPPIPSANGARFISRETVKSGGDRSFDVSKFEKSGSMTTRLDFFKELNGKTNNINLSENYSDNNFSSFGRNTSVCFIEK